jgi:predicted nucleic acid-binding protein
MDGCSIQFLKNLCQTFVRIGFDEQNIARSFLAFQQSKRMIELNNLKIDLYALTRREYEFQLSTDIGCILSSGQAEG